MKCFNFQLQGPRHKRQIIDKAFATQECERLMNTTIVNACAEVPDFDISAFRKGCVADAVVNNLYIYSKAINCIYSNIIYMLPLYTVSYIHHFTSSSFENKIILKKIYCDWVVSIAARLATCVITTCHFQSNFVWVQLNMKMIFKIFDDDV